MAKKIPTKKAPLFSKGFQPKSTNKKAKQLIRNEALSRFTKDFGWDNDGGRTLLDRMKNQADSANGGLPDWKHTSDYNKARYLVDGGYYRCYYDDQAEFLSKIYGKENVANWDGNKIHNTYAHLIAREYAAMLSEREKGKLQRTSSHTVSIRTTPSTTKKKRSKK